MIKLLIYNTIYS